MSFIGPGDRPYSDCLAQALSFPSNLALSHYMSVTGCYSVSGGEGGGANKRSVGCGGPNEEFMWVNSFL